MTGSRFARTLKQDREIRADFEAWIMEHRAHASREMESGSDLREFLIASGKIRQIDQLMVALDAILSNES